MSIDLLPPPGEFRTTQEIRDAKLAEKLARRRKLMLLWSAPVVLIVFLAAAKLLSAVLLNLAGTSAYEKQNYVTATDRFSSLAFFNVVEPWKAPFNEGTAVYATGDFFTAKEHLDVALGLVPTAPEGEPRGEEECMVRTNYSLALEGLGDEAMIASDFAMSTDYYEQAQTMLADCGEAGGNGGEQAEQAEERQQQSQEESQEQQEQQEQEQQGGGGEDGEEESESPSEGESGGESESPSEGESGGESESPSEGESGGESESPSEGESGGEQSQSPSPGESTDPREEELAERNQEAQESREAEEQQSGGGDGSGQNW